MKKIFYAAILFVSAAGFAAAQEGSQSGMQTYAIHFEPWTADITDRALSIPTLGSVSETLSSVLTVMQNDPSVRVLLEGFANPVTGSNEERNDLWNLSAKRAKETENKFVRSGINRDRFITVAMGGVEGPPPSSDIEKAKNRRVQITLVRPGMNGLFVLKFDYMSPMVVGKDLFAIEEIESLQTVRKAVDYIKSSPSSRVIVQGSERLEEFAPRKVKLAKQRADEVVRILKKELGREGIINTKFTIVSADDTKESTAVILVLPAAK